jgi:hypothetical protein
MDQQTAPSITGKASVFSPCKEKANDITSSKEPHVNQLALPYPELNRLHKRTVNEQVIDRFLI